MKESKQAPVNRKPTKQIKSKKKIEVQSDSDDSSYKTSQEVVISSSSVGTSSSDSIEPKQNTSVLSRVVNTVGAFITGTDKVNEKPAAKRGRPPKRK